MYMYVCMYVCIYIYIYIHAYTYIYILIMYTCIHTHIHTHICIQPRPGAEACLTSPLATGQDSWGGLRIVSATYMACSLETSTLTTCAPETSLRCCDCLTRRLLKL